MAASKDEKLDTLPDEVLLRIAGYLASKQDIANLRLTCHALHGSATEVYAKVCSKREALEATTATVQAMAAIYETPNAWKGPFVAYMQLEFPDTLRGKH